MRIGFGLVAGLAVVVLEVGASWSAASGPNKPGAMPTNSVSTTSSISTPRMPSPLNGARAALPGLRALPLSENECKDLGGSIFNESACASGKECYTSDEHGNAHEVCISKKE